MSTARRATRALMAVSTFIRAPWGVSLAVKATINARPRPPTSHQHHQQRLLCDHAAGGDHHGVVPGKRKRTAATAASDEVAVLAESAAVERDTHESVEEKIDVSESEVLCREDWMARAEAHRARCYERCRLDY